VGAFFTQKPIEDFGDTGAFFFGQVQFLLKGLFYPFKGETLEKFTYFFSH